MSHYINEIDNPTIVNKNELSLFFEPSEGYLGNFKFTWRFIWYLIKAKFKKGDLYVWVIPGHNFQFTLQFYRQLNIK